MMKLDLTSVIAYYIDQNWALHEVQLAFDEIDYLICSPFNSYLRMIGQGPTYWSKASRTFEDILDRFELTDGCLLGITTDMLHGGVCSSSLMCARAYANVWLLCRVTRHVASTQGRSMTNGANYKSGKLHHSPWHSDICTFNQLNTPPGRLSRPFQTQQ